MAEAGLPIRMGERIPPQPQDDAIVPVPPILHPTIWDDQTYTFSADDAASLAQHMIAPAAAAGTMSAGEFRTTANGKSTNTLDHATNKMVLARYYPYTEVECSVTVRDPKTRASGWAGVNHYGLHKIDPQAIAARALDKCQRSANPSAIEPGRFTTILEPQAVADLFWPLVSSYAMERWYA
jgi:predicted Zn-dependent protease